MNVEELERERITSLDNNKTMFVSLARKQDVFSNVSQQGCFSIVWSIANITLSITWASKLIQVQIFSTWFNQHPAFGSNQRMINCIVPF